MKLAATVLAVASLLASSAPVVRAQDSPTSTKQMHTYRLTYTLIEMEQGRKVGVQHYSLTADPQSHAANIKLMSKVPFGTASSSTGAMSQYSYYDIGLTIYATLTSYENGIQVETTLDKTDIAEASKSSAGAPPVIREANLNNSATLAPGKSVQLGSLDVPGSTHHYEVELLLEQVF